MESLPPETPALETSAPPPSTGGCGCSAPEGKKSNGNAVAVVGVRLRGQTRVSQFNSNERDFEMGDRVLVEGEHGPEIGEVAQPTTRALRSCSIGCMRRVLRTAAPEDLEAFDRRAAQEDEAAVDCRERITARKLSMRLVRVEQNPDTKKLTFFFSSDGRVDFRDLVRDLAQRFHCRIEMRQIGVRDEAGIRGGYGDCGKALCCSTFLKEFAPISIKMAREQNLSLNPSKISGMCGRLKCCLRYEYQPATGDHGILPEDEVLPSAPIAGESAPAVP
jgi:cell fate regulator YaaT (PSP1 superfamily)